VPGNGRPIMKMPRPVGVRSGAGYLDRRSGASKRIVSLSRCGTITDSAICVDKCRAFIRHKPSSDDGLSYASVLRPFLLATLKLKFRPVCRERASIFRITGSCRTYPGTVRLLRDGLSLAPQCWG